MFYFSYEKFQNHAANSIISLNLKGLKSFPYVDGNDHLQIPTHVPSRTLFWGVSNFLESEREVAEGPRLCQL